MHFNLFVCFTCLVWLAASSVSAAEDPSLAPHRTYGAWHSGVIGGGGFLQHVVFAPSDAKRLYLSSDVGGCWRSDDAGATWHMLHGALPAEAASYSMRGIVVDPRNADTVLIAADSGVWRSIDAGRSWKKTLQAAWQGNGDHREDGRILAFDLKNSDTIYAAANGSGFHVSHDGGLTWKGSGPDGLFPIDLHQDVAEGKRLWLSSAARKDGVGGLFLSEDSGATWKRIREQGIGEMVQFPGQPGVLIARMLDHDRVGRSTDGGRTWSRFDDGLAAPKDDARSDGSYGALTTGPDFVLLGGNGGSFYRLDASAAAWKKVIWKKEDVDEGEWWGGLKQPTHWHFGSALGWLAVDPRDPQHWAFTDWYALYQSHSGGTRWKQTIDGIEMTVVHVVTQDFADPKTVHVGVADVGCFQSQDGGSTFSQNHLGISNNIKHIAACAGSPKRLYAVGPQRWEWQANQVFRSDDGGATWMRPKMQGLGEMEHKRCNTIVVHPQNPDECYLVLDGAIAVQGGGVWRSQDAGETWTWIGQGLPAMDRCFRSDIWVAGPEVAVSADGSVVACSDDRGRIFRRDPHISSWQEVLFTGMKGGANAVTADPRTPGRFWLCRKDGGLWRSDDGGASWTRMCDRDAWAVAVDANDAKRIAVNGSQGIYFSRDAGASWVALSSALPYRHLRNVVAFAGERLMVGTGGNGVFWSDLAAAPMDPSAMGEPLRIALVPASGSGSGSASASASATAELLVNGDMRQGTEMPAEWTIAGGDRPGARLLRDTLVFRSAPAALRLDMLAPDAAFAQQRLIHAPQGRMQLSGAVHVEGESKARIPMQVFDGAWKQIAWIETSSFAAKPGWQEFRTIVELPAGAENVMVGVLGEGRGSVWLDDISVQVAQPDQPTQ